MQSITEIAYLLSEAEKELATLDARRAIILEQIKSLSRERELINQTSCGSSPSNNNPPATNQFFDDEKISLFRALFRGREDVYPKRFESVRTGKKGYQPACRNEWLRGICGKPKIRCNDCENRKFLPVTDEVIRNHLLGIDPQYKSKHDFTIGVYPLLPDETCWFLAADFDKTTWMEDISAFLEACKSYNIPAALERSRSGKGGHVWIFFPEPVPAMLAAKNGLIYSDRNHGAPSRDRYRLL